MDYAIQLFLPILLGLMLGAWLNRTFGLSPIWMVILAILGMAGGIAILYKRYAYPELYPGQKKLPFFKPGKKLKSKQDEKLSPTIQDLDDLYQQVQEEEPEDDDEFGFLNDDSDLPNKHTDDNEPPNASK